MTDLRKTKDHFASTFDIVAIASSAGVLKVLIAVLAGLPSDLPASIMVVQHLDPNHKSLMAEILSRKTQLKVKEAEDGETLAKSTVYIAKPDKRLLVNPNCTISLTSTKLVNFIRPSADLLFQSVAKSRKDGAIAVVLSGTGQDGAKGAQAIKKMGGKVIVQDAAEFPGMPKAAIEAAVVDFVLPVEKIAPAFITNGDSN
jgi:two-component system, chemotaxis family, protein-glutamate methylesterase/glutaminase